MGVGPRGGVAVVLALLGACSFDARFDGVGFRCDSENRCPDGTTCVSGTCELAGNMSADADPDSDSGLSGDGGDDRTLIERACPGVILDQDPFDFEALSRWFSFENGNATIGVEDGVSRSHLMEASARTGMVTSASYPLGDIAFAIRFAAPAPAVNTYAALEIITQSEETALITIYRSGAIITAERALEGMSGEVLHQEVYSADDQRVWRIRHQDDVITWETSSDAVTWVKLFDKPAWVELPDFIRIRLVMETNSQSSEYEQDVDDWVACDLP